MGRRWGGLIIMVLVAVAAIAIPSAGGKQISGTARPAPIPGPPAVAQCLEAPVIDAAQNPGARYRPLTVGLCGKRVYGEVTAVLGDRRSPQSAQPTIRTPDDGSTVTDDPNELTCFDATNRYLGLTVGADHIPTIFSYWRPSGLASFSLTGPTLRQRAAGQQWVACVVYTRDWDRNAASYQGTLKNAFALGTLPAAVAVCLDTANLLSAESASCDKPHYVEVFGVADTARPGLTQRSLDDSCLRLAARMTGMSDPTAHGRIQLRAATVHGETPVTGLGAANDENGYAVCMAVTPRTHQLQRTLLALRNKPLPWFGR